LAPARHTTKRAIVQPAAFGQPFHRKFLLWYNPCGQHLISDYLFAKSRLFAHLNLHGDEWDLYERTHGALAEHIPLPDLIVYLRASVDVLMARIARRARPYERVVERSYITALSAAYEEFFAGYNETPVVAIDTDELDIVVRPADYSRLEGHVLDALPGAVYQPALGIRNANY